MSRMTTPASFIAAVVFVLFGLTIIITIATKSLAVFVIGIVLSMVIPRVMIGDVE